MTFSFPASATFSDDKRVTPTLLRLYRWAYRTLDFRQVRGRKSSAIAFELSINESDVSRALTQLVAWGYLIEHERVDRTRQFTLAWSVHEDLQLAG